MKYLIVGLGNIGAEYAATRHNIGFDIVDEFAKSLDADFSIEKNALKASAKIKGKQVVIIKPTTYMNLSGKAVRYWMTQEKIDIQNILVIVDDLALPFGSIRLKGKGSDAGHNGLKDIQHVLQTNKYPRLRFGIGDDFRKGKQIDFVLGKWTEDEWIDLQPRITVAVEAIKSFCSIGLNYTMNNFNNK